MRERSTGPPPQRLVEECSVAYPDGFRRAPGSMLSGGSPTLDGFLRGETDRRIDRLPYLGLSGIRAWGAGDWWDSQFSGGLK